MIEIRLFATLRENRGKLLYLEPEAVTDGYSILNRLEIPEEEVAIFLINGFHSKPDQLITDGDIIAIFPPVGGG